MATSILLLVLVHVVAAGGSAECWSNCKTCYSGRMKWVCLSCYEGTFGKREGAYSVCVDCPDGCISCSYYGFCDKCSPGRYGRGCEYNCSEGCVNNTCDKGSGECTCKDGFAGLNCSQCISGRYGPSCQFTCNNGCKEGTCEPGTGSCICKANHIVYVRSEVCTVNNDCTATTCSSDSYVICEHPIGGIVTNGGLCTCALNDYTCSTRQYCMTIAYNCQNSRKRCYDGKCICSRF